MNCGPTLTVNEFSQIHNALGELRSVHDQLESVVREPITDKLARAISAMEQALVGAYAQDNEAFERKNSHYSQSRRLLNLQSVWSIYEVDDLSAQHEFDGATTVMYTEHWGGTPVRVDINGPTWASLYVAADQCIRDSGDAHHIYIEAFHVSQEDPSVLILSTGS